MPHAPNPAPFLPPVDTCSSGFINLTHKSFRSAAMIVLLFCWRKIEWGKTAGKTGGGPLVPGLGKDGSKNVLTSIFFWGGGGVVMLANLQPYTYVCTDAYFSTYKFLCINIKTQASSSEKVRVVSDVLENSTLRPSVRVAGSLSSP